MQIVVETQAEFDLLQGQVGEMIFRLKGLSDILARLEVIYPDGPPDDLKEFTRDVTFLMDQIAEFLPFREGTDILIGEGRSSQ